MTYFASEKRALGVCDRCGFTYKLRELRMEVDNDRPNNLRVCPECWDPQHPQTELGDRPIYDPQALRNPRPDNRQYAEVRSLTYTPNGLSRRAVVGSLAEPTGYGTGTYGSGGYGES